MSRDNTIQLQVDFGKNTLYNIGYFLTDLNQILILCDLIAENDFQKMHRWFDLENKVSMNRNASLMNYGDNYRITEIHHGSLVLVFGGISAVATVLIPLLIYQLQKSDAAKSQEVKFNIETEYYDEASYLIDLYRRTDGFASENINALFDVLRINGYNIECSSDDIYTISKTLDRYFHRTVKLVKRNHK